MSDTTKEAEFDADVFDSMLHGNFDETNTEVADDADEVVDTAEDAEDTLEDNDEYQEDTDQEEESEDDEELDEAGDGELDEDSETEDDDEEEDTLVEDYDSDDEDGEEDTEEDEADEAEEPDEENSDEESEDEADTEETSDGKPQDTDGVDYKAFYDAVVNTEFVVNGKKVKGFADPKKIIQSQQMAGGFSEKMAGFKQYRPFMAPLKDRGMLDDQAKFDLAMNLVDGDKEAIKQHLQSLGVDPLDLDMEKIDYRPVKATASQETIVVEDALERAKTAGIEDKFRQVIGKEWDAESFQEFTTNQAVREDLLNHMETGAYDTVQDKMLELKRLDYNGAYSGMSTIQQYRAAVQELQKEYNATPQTQETPTAPTPAAVKKPSVKTEKAKITNARKEAEYKEKAAQQEAKLNQQRKRAASMSKKKPRAKAKPKFDPLELQGDELSSHLDFLMTGGR